MTNFNFEQILRHLEEEMLLALAIPSDLLFGNNKSGLGNASQDQTIHPEILVIARESPIVAGWLNNWRAGHSSYKEAIESIVTRLAGEYSLIKHRLTELDYDLDNKIFNSSSLVEDVVNSSMNEEIKVLLLYEAVKNLTAILVRVMEARPPSPIAISSTSEIGQMLLKSIQKRPNVEALILIRERFGFSFDKSEQLGNNWIQAGFGRSWETLYNYLTDHKLVLECERLVLRSDP